MHKIGNSYIPVIFTKKVPKNKMQNIAVPIGFVLHIVCRRRAQLLGQVAVMALLLYLRVRTTPPFKSVLLIILYNIKKFSLVSDLVIL